MVKITLESIGNVVLPTREPLGILLDACIKEKCGVMECHVNANGCLDWVGINSGELSEVGLAEPTSGRGVELSVIKRAQLPRFSRPATMSTHGVIIDAMYSRRLFDARKQSSSGISKCHAKPLSE